MSKKIYDVEPGNSFVSDGVTFNVLRVPERRYIKTFVVDWDENCNRYWASDREYNEYFDTMPVTPRADELKPGDEFEVNYAYDYHTRTGKFVGKFSYWILVLDLVSFDVTTQHATKKSQIKSVGAAVLHDGDRTLYNKFVSNPTSGSLSFLKYKDTKGVLDLTNAVVVGEKRIVPVGCIDEKRIEKFTRSSIISYIIALNGPSDAVSILRQAALVQGKPYIPHANSSYLKRGEFFVKVGGQKHSSVYSLTAKGFIAASSVLAELGREPARLAREAINDPVL